MGGTSVGPPIYAGIVAVANQIRQRPVGYINDWIYSQYTRVQATKSPPFHDVVGGNNAFLPSGSSGYSAVAGYDLATGLGTPNTNNLLNVLVAKP
jgi:subtilase family serine protease